MSEMNMDNILNPSTEVETPEVINEVEKPAEKPTGEEVAASPAVIEEKPAEKPEIKADDTETVTALRAEIDRIRAKNREYETMLKPPQAQHQAPQQQPEGEPKTFWDDPEGTIAQAVTGVRQEMTARILDISEASARARHADYNDKFNVFAELVSKNPHIYQTMLAQPDPAEWAYQTAARQAVMQDIGDPLEYRSKIEQEIRAQIALEKAEEDKKKADEMIADKLPRSFSETRNVGTGDKTTQFNPNIPMKDILAPKKK